MGITIEEYLAQREACAVCDAEGNTDYCITHMLSRYDNCLFYNAVINNSNSYDDADVVLLQNLRSAVPGQRVLEYYTRSEPLVRAFKLQYGNNQDFWNTIYNRFISSVIENLRNNNNEQAAADIFAMLDTLEQENPQ
jgi:hypothetical protein